MFFENMETWKRIIHKVFPMNFSFSAKVKGNSMFPVLVNGDVVDILISQDEQYHIGDILVFPYQNEGVLIHRLLKKENGRYFCKGDNSFRLEDVPADAIIGVAQVKDDFGNNQEFVKESLLIAKIYGICGYDASIARLQKEYISYRKRYLTPENTSMDYTRKSNISGK